MEFENKFKNFSIGAGCSIVKGIGNLNGSTCKNSDKTNDLLNENKAVIDKAETVNSVTKTIGTAVSAIGRLIRKK